MSPHGLSIAPLRPEAKSNPHDAPEWARRIFATSVSGPTGWEKERQRALKKLPRPFRAFTDELVELYRSPTTVHRLLRDLEKQAQTETGPGDEVGHTANQIIHRTMKAHRLSSIRIEEVLPAGPLRDLLGRGVVPYFASQWSFEFHPTEDVFGIETERDFF